MIQYTHAFVIQTAIQAVAHITPVNPQYPGSVANEIADDIEWILQVG
jgi:hypothetical protein